MKRVKFNAEKFRKFMDATPGLDWVESFNIQGFKTYEYHADANSYPSYPRHSLSEEEYTWFIMRWS